MNKKDLKLVVDELRAGKSYPDVDDSALHGIALSDFPKGKVVRKEAVVRFLNYQCRWLFAQDDSEFDEEELTNCLGWLKEKRVVMV